MSPAGTAARSAHPTPGPRRCPFRVSRSACCREASRPTDRQAGDVMCYPVRFYATRWRRQQRAPLTAHGPWPLAGGRIRRLEVALDAATRASRARRRCGRDRLVQPPGASRTHATRVDSSAFCLALAHDGRLARVALDRSVHSDDHLGTSEGRRVGSAHPQITPAQAGVDGALRYCGGRARAASGLLARGVVQRRAMRVPSAIQQRTAFSRSTKQW